MLGLVSQINALLGAPKEPQPGTGPHAIRTPAPDDAQACEPGDLHRLLRYCRTRAASSWSWLSSCSSITLRAASISGSSTFSIARRARRRPPLAWDSVPLPRLVLARPYAVSRGGRCPTAAGVRGSSVRSRPTRAGRPTAHPVHAGVGQLARNRAPLEKRKRLMPRPASPEALHILAAACIRSSKGVPMAFIAPYLGPGE